MTEPGIPEVPSTDAQGRPTTGQGCGMVAVFIIVLTWIVASIAVSQLLSWTMEQTLFEIEYNVPDFRWIITLAFGASIALPLWGLFRLIKSPRSKLIYRTWMMAGLFALLMIPGRLLPLYDVQTVAVIQLGGIGIYLFGLKFWRDTRPNRGGAGWNGWHLRGGGVSVLLAALLAIPWILWGALGSVEDILLNIAVGLLFGVAVEQTLLDGYLYATQTMEREYRPADFGVDGFVAGLTILIMTTGLGQTGTQTLLSLVVPILGWVVVGLNLYARKHPEQLSWLAAALLPGLAAVWALLFFDPSELSLVIGSGTGEVVGWAIQSAWTSLLIGGALSILSFVYFLRWIDLSLPKALSAVFYGVAAVVLVGAYLIWGRVGLFGEQLFVVFKDQVDVTPAYKITDLNQRRSYVYQTLTQKADQTQTRVRGFLSQWGIPFTPFYLVDGMEINGGILVRLWLEAQPEVDRVLASPHLRPLPQPLPASLGTAPAPGSQPDWNITLIGADRVWKELGANGTGILIGQSDTGVQGDHPEVAQNFRGGSDSWFDPWSGSRKPFDLNGHGTHTLGTILGQRVGIAPGAQWIGCSNLARNQGNMAYYLDCMQFMLAPFKTGGDPFKDGNPQRGAMVLNNSWGCPPLEGCDAESLLPAVRSLRAAGIFVVVSAGNSGYMGCGSVSDPPAIYSEVYSVGAIDKDSVLTTFSSMGPVLVDGSKRIKPDITAPGNDVLSAFPGNSYEILSGTSMAGPHIVGVVALMWSANPKLIGNIDLTTEILDKTAKAYTGDLPPCAVKTDRPNTGVGFGIVDAYAAVKMAIDQK